MSDTTCKYCHFPKPDIAFPSKHGKRTGLRCLACAGEKRRHKRVNPPTKDMLHRAALRTYVCPACKSGYPYIYPNTLNAGRGIPEGTLCRGCTNRERAQRRKA